jgi:hypothetical protein
MTNASTASSREPIDTQEWMRAAGAGDAARIESLLAAGADVNATLEGGDTALIRATSKGRLHVVQVLIEAGADPNVERDDGFTALGMAVFFGYADIVRALLAGGADPAAKGRLGMTVEKWARFSGFDEIVEMLRDREPTGAQGHVEGSAASMDKSGAALFFPSEGTFSSVVPLSKIDEMLEPSGDDPKADEPFKAVESVNVRNAVGESEREEQEETTLVPQHVSPSTTPERLGPSTTPQRVSLAASPRPTHPVSPEATHAMSPKTTHAFRPKGVRQSWPVMAVVLALSVSAGIIVGAYLIGSRQSAETLRPAPLAEDATPSAEAASQSPESQSAAATSDAQPSQSDAQPSQHAPQLPEPLPTAEPESAAAPAVTHAVAAGEADARNERTNVVESALKPAPRATASAIRRAPESEPTARRVTNAEARPARTANGGGDNLPATKPAQRDVAATARRARAAEERSSNPAPSKHSILVSSPPPSAKSRKVIQWP